MNVPSPANEARSSNTILNEQIKEVYRMTGIRCDILPSMLLPGGYDLFVGVPGGTMLQGLRHSDVWFSLWAVVATHRHMTRDEKPREVREEMDQRGVAVLGDPNRLIPPTGIE